MKPLERLICGVIGIGFIALAVTTFLALSSLPAAAEHDATAIRPFRVNIPEKELVELRRRIEATRWPTRELVKDRSQGVQLATLRELARYWTTDYDWRKCEARLNALPQFTTEIDGVKIHFIHVPARERDAADHDAWLARLGHRAARDRRSPDRPDQVRRHSRRCIPRGAAVLARLRFLGRADRARLAVRPHRRRVGKADGAPRLHALRRPGRRCGCLRHRRDGAPGA